MDQEKVGKFIAECRKNKKLTQEGLGKELSVNGKSISKWERGINTPDISLLIPLCTILGITVVELLKGELNKKNSKNSNDEAVVESIKLYSKRNTLKNIKWLIFIFVCLISSFATIFVINNFNKNKIYTIESQNSDFNIAGYIIFNQEKKLLIINKIQYFDKYIGTDKEIIAKDVEFQLQSNNKVFFSYEDSFDIEEDTLYPISYYLDKASISVTEDNSHDIDVLTSKNLNNLVLIVKYVDQKNENKEIVVDLSTFEEFANNKFFY